MLPFKGWLSTLSLQQGCYQCDPQHDPILQDVQRWPPCPPLPAEPLRPLESAPEITSRELLPDQLVPLLKRRWELSREEALRL